RAIQETERQFCKSCLRWAGMVVESRTASLCCPKAKRRMVMSAPPSSPTRRDFLALAAAAGAASLVPASVRAATGGDSIQPFSVNFPDEALADLRRRLAATRLPEKENVADTSQGVQLATMQSLVRYWATDYDWRKTEAKLNALPQFITEIDGLDI